MATEDIVSAFARMLGEIGVPVVRVDFQPTQKGSVMHRKWHVQGQYGYWVVQETRPEDGSGGVYNQISPIPTKKLATLIAGELNTAYWYGREDQLAEKFALEYEGQYGPDHDGGV